MIDLATFGTESHYDHFSFDSLHFRPTFGQRKVKLFTLLGLLARGGESLASLGGLSEPVVLP